MLQRVRLTDFKSFADEEIALAPLTILLGANASGKSNFLDALRFLQQTTVDQTLSEILDGQERRSGRWPGIRGGSQESARIGTSGFAIESTWTVPTFGALLLGKGSSPVERLVDLTHRIECETAPRTQLKAESLGRGRQEESLYRTGKIERGRIEVPWPPLLRMEGRPVDGRTWLTRDQSVLLSSREHRSVDSPEIPEDIHTAMFELSSAFGNLRFPDADPARMRGYGRRKAPLQDDGGNLSGVLADLCEDPDDKRTFVEWLAELCAPEIADIDFIEVPELKDVMAVLVEKSGKRISARSLSDGTLRFLGLLLALRTVPPGSVVLLEDIESHLHPTRIRLLVEYLEAVTRTRDVQVIATTHSPVVLQWLKEDALGSAVVFGRTPEHDGTRMRRLADLPHFEEVVKRKGIDDLFTTGWLEMAL